MNKRRNSKPRFLLLLSMALFGLSVGLPANGAMLYATDIGCYEYGYTTPGSTKSKKEEFDSKLYGGTGTTFYVDVNGSDSSGNGSRKSPWATLSYAAEQVTQRGDIIHLGPGVHEIESRVFLIPGVSLEGEQPEGKDEESPSILTSHSLTAEWNSALINLASEPKRNTDGNQYVAWLTFDGSLGRTKGNSSASQAIEVANRNNVAVHHCTIRNFQWIGVGWRATDTQMVAMYNPQYAGQPECYVTGGRFYNNKMENCAFYGASENDNGYPWGRGSLMCGGLKDFRIYNNTISEQCAQDRLQGVPIKFWYYTGWMLGCRIHDNTIMRLGSTANSTDSAGWAFALESTYHSGLEISNNTIVGAIDLNNGYYDTFDGTKYDYATWIHDNRFVGDLNKKGGFEQFAIVLESETYKTIVERNRIENYAAAVYFNIRVDVSDFTFRYNLCSGLRGEGAASATGIRMDGSQTIDVDRNGDGQNDKVVIEVNDMRIYNNLFIAERGGFGLILGQGIEPWNGRKILVANNIMYGFDYNWLTLDNFASLNQVLVENNIYTHCGGWNGSNNESPEGFISSSGMVGKIVHANNFGLQQNEFEALFVSPGDFYLAKNSHAINAGKKLGKQKDLEGTPVPFKR